MSNDDFGGIFLIFMVVLVISCVGFYGCGVSEGTNYMKFQAVKSGSARWVATEDGSCIFEWKNNMSRAEGTDGN